MTSYRTLLGLPVLCLADATAAMEYLLEAGRRSQGGIKIAFANANLLKYSRSNESVRNCLSSFLLLNDGIGADIASFIKHGKRFPSNLNGTDFVPEFLARSGYRNVFLLGGRPGVAELAGRALEKAHPNIKIVGAAHGYVKVSNADSVCMEIHACSADILLVGMGNPLQELWLDSNFEKTGCKFGFAVGAFLDFNAGVVKRAPHWMRRWKLEWLYRFMLEPKRLFKRYTIDIALFVLVAIGDEVRELFDRSKRLSK